MKAVILAGGFGTRLRSIVSEVPKGMASIAGKPFLEYQVSWLVAQGIEGIILCLGYMAEKIIEHFGDGKAFGVHITYSEENEPLGTGGALRLAKDLLPSRFLVLNGDTIVDMPVKEMIVAHNASRAIFSIALVRVDDVAAYGEVVTDEHGRVQAFREKGRHGPGLINAGLYIMEKSILDAIPPGRACSLEKEVLPRLLAEGRPIYGFVHQGYFLDIGTPENYKRAQEEIPGRFYR
ncbi:MAG: mannose-phosphate guanylyltransferase [Moorella sp. (in: firmicutes)]|nr:mannose-phosphate guanylyltransferase [Moorella sp. (in: firmicutes)]